MTQPPHSTEPCERVSRSAADTLAAYLADLTLPAWNEFRAAHGKPPEPHRAGPPVTAEEARAAATEWWQFEVLPGMLPAERAEAEPQAATTQPIPPPIPPQSPRRQHKPKTPKRVPSPDTITATTPLRLDIAAQIAFPDGSVSVSGLRREIQRGNLRAEMIAGKMFTTLANIDDMRKKCAVPTKAPESSSENHGGQENRTDGSSSTAMPADVASSARQAHLRQIAQRLRASGQTPKKPSPTISDESTSRNSAAVIRLKSE